MFDVPWKHRVVVSLSEEILDALRQAYGPSVVHPIWSILGIGRWCGLNGHCHVKSLSILAESCHVYVIKSSCFGQPGELVRNLPVLRLKEVTFLFVSIKSCLSGFQASNSQIVQSGSPSTDLVSVGIGA